MRISAPVGETPGDAIAAFAGWRLGVLAAVEVGDFLADAHAAPVVAAHGAEVGVDFQVLVVVGAGQVRVEAEVEVAAAS